MAFRRNITLGTKINMRGRLLAGVLEPVLSPQLKEALADSLKWKSSEVLEKIKVAVDDGEKPKLRGRESCLFLEVGGSEIML